MFGWLAGHEDPNGAATDGRNTLAVERGRMSYEVVAKTRAGFNRRVGVYPTQDEAEKQAEAFSTGEGVDTMVKPVQEGVA